MKIDFLGNKSVSIDTSLMGTFNAQYIGVYFIQMLYDLNEEILPQFMDFCLEMFSIPKKYQKISIKILQNAIKTKPRQKQIYEELVNYLTHHGLLNEKFSSIFDEYDTVNDGIYKYIKTDDIKNFQDCFNSQYYNCKQETLADILDECAFYGSIKCFKYLLLNDITPTTKTLYNSIAGNSNDIVNIITNKYSIDKDINKCIEIGIQYNNTNLLKKYLITDTKYMISDNDDFFNNPYFLSFLIYEKNIFSYDDQDKLKQKLYIKKYKFHKYFTYCLQNLNSLNFQYISQMYNISESDTMTYISRIKNDYQEIMKEDEFLDCTKYYLNNIVFLSKEKTNNILNFIKTQYYESSNQETILHNITEKYKSTDIFGVKYEEIITIIITFYKIIYTKYIPSSQYGNSRQIPWSYEDLSFLCYRYFKDGKITESAMQQINRTLNSGKIKIVRLKETYLQMKKNISLSELHFPTNTSDILEKIKTTLDILKVLHEELTSIRNSTELLSDFKNKSNRSNPIEVIEKNIKQTEHSIEMLITTMSNLTKDNVAKRYFNENLNLLNTILLTLGSKSQSIVSQFFGLSSRSTAQRRKCEQLNTLFDGAIPKFNGELYDIEKLFNAYYIKPQEKNALQKGGILAIDAASIEPIIHIYNNGDIEGIRGLTHIDPNIAAEIKENKEKRKEFYAKYEKQIITHVFLIIFCPIDPSLHYLPVMKITHTSGFANSEIRNTLLNIKETISTQLKIPIKGLGFDGDLTYKIFGQDLYNKFYDSFMKKNIKCLITDIFEVSLCFYYDSIHLTKNDRSKLSKEVSYYIWPSNNVTKFSHKDILALNILDPQIFTRNSQEAQHDKYPMDLFSISTLKELLLNNRIDIAFSILPNTLLLTSIFDQKISRTLRINILTLAAAYILMYMIERQYINIHKSTKNLIQQPQNHHKTIDNENQSYARFSETWAIKFFATVYSLLTQLVDFETSINMASLGSNLCEHCFGTNRHFAAENKTINGFNRALINTVLHNTFAAKENINIRINKRSSTTEAYIYSEQNQTQEYLFTLESAIATIYRFLEELNNRQEPHDTMVCGSCFFYCHYFKRIIRTLYVSHVMIIYIVIHTYYSVFRPIKTALITRG